MKNLIEIDCNESIWTAITSEVHNGWGNLENESRFAFATKSRKITVDDIDDAFWTKFPDADQIETNRVTLNKDDCPDKEKGMYYFVVSMIIYNSNI